MLRNIFSNWFGLFLAGILGAILTPIMVHHLGNLYYGMWVLLGSLLDYAGLLDLGMRTTLFRYVAFFKGAEQRGPLNEVFSTGMAISLGLMTFTMLLATGLSRVLPTFFKFTGNDKFVFMVVIVLLGLSIAASFPSQFMSAYMRGLQRFDLYNVSMVVYATARAVAIVVLLELKFGIIAIAIATAILTAASVGMNWALVKSADPDLHPSIRCLTWARTREMFNFGFFSFVNNSGESLRYYTDSFVIGRVLSVALITPFSIATRLMEYYKTLVSGISGPIMVRLSELTGRDREEELREEFLRATRFAALLSIFISCMLILNGKALIRLWVGPALLASYPILVVLTVGYIFTWGQVTGQLLIFARARRHKGLSWWTLVEGGANLALSIYWARRYGIIGVALGTTVPLLASKLIVQPWYVLKDLNMSAWAYFEGGLARGTLAGGIFFAGLWLLLRNHAMGGNYFMLFGCCVVETILFAALAYWIGMSESDRCTVRDQWRVVALSLGLARGV